MCLDHRWFARTTVGMLDTSCEVGVSVVHWDEIIATHEAPSVNPRISTAARGAAHHATREQVWMRFDSLGNYIRCHPPIQDTNGMVAQESLCCTVKNCCDLLHSCTA